MCYFLIGGICGLIGGVKFILTHPGYANFPIQGLAAAVVIGGIYNGGMIWLIATLLGCELR